jgi:hypothetical protein
MILKTSIRLILAFEMAFGSFPALSQEVAAKPQLKSVANNKTLAKSSPDPELFYDLQAALSRAMFPDVPRKDPGLPSADEIRSLSDRIETVRDILTKKLNANSLKIELQTQIVDGKEVDVAEEEPTWFAELRFYLQEAETLERIRMAAGLPSEPSGFSRYDIRLSLDQFAMVNLLHIAAPELRKEEAQAPFNILQIRLNPRGRTLIFSLNPERTIVLNTSRLSTTAGEGATKSYLEWLAYHGFYSNLIKINQLQRRDVSVLPEPSSQFKSRFPLAAHFKEFAQREDDLYVWQQQYKILKEIVPSIVQKLADSKVFFVTEDFIKELDPQAKLMTSEEIAEPLAQSHAAEVEQAMTYASDLLYFNQYPYAINASQWKDKLVETIADTIAASARFAFVSSKTELELKLEARPQMFEVITARRKAYMADPNLNHIVAAALTPAVVASLSREQVLFSQRKDFENELQKKALSVKNPPQEIDNTAWVQSRLSAMRDFFDLVPDEILGNLQSESDFALAEINYEKILLLKLSVFEPNAFGDLFDKKPLSLKDINTKLANVKLANVAGLSSEQIAQKLNKEKALSQALVQVGQILKYDLSRETKLDDLKLAKAELRSYKLHYLNRALIIYPILTSQIGRGLFDQPMLIAKMQSGNVSDLITQHLLQLETNIVSACKSIEDSTAPVGSLSGAFKSFTRWTGISHASDSLDDVSPELLVLIRHGSLLAANIQAQPALASSYGAMAQSLNGSSDFNKAGVFLQETGYAMMMLMLIPFAITLISKIPAGKLLNYFSGTSAVGKGFAWAYTHTLGLGANIRDSMKVVAADLEPLFGPNGAYLNKTLTVFFAGDLTNRAVQVASSNWELDTLYQFYHSNAQLPAIESHTTQDMLKNCYLLGTCAVRNEDIQQADLVQSKKKEEFTTGMVFVVGYILMIGGINRVKALLSSRQASQNARLAIDWEVLGIKEPSQWTFDSLTLNQQALATGERLNSIVHPGTLPRAILNRVIESSQRRLENALNKEVAHWETLTEETHAESIHALSLDRRDWMDKRVLNSRRQDIENSNLPDQTKNLLYRHINSISEELNALNKRADKDPVYEVLMRDGLARFRGADGNVARSIVPLNTDLQIANLFKFKERKSVVVSSELPAPVQQLIKRMEDEGVMNEMTHEVLLPRSKIYRRYVKWIQEGAL